MRLTAATRRLPRALLAGLLAVVLLHAQGLGQWHRVAHAGLHGAQGAPGTQATAHDPFGHPADDAAQCRLYDHLGAADGLLHTLAALSSEPAPQLAVPALPDGQVGRAARPYQARAPPRA